MNSRESVRRYPKPRPASVVPRNLSLLPPDGFLVDQQTGEVLSRPIAVEQRLSRCALYEEASNGPTGPFDWELKRRERIEKSVAVEPPPGGWREFWRRTGERRASAYLEKKAKTAHIGRACSAKDRGVAWPDGEFRTCGEAGLETRRGWGVIASCASGEHLVAKAIACGREWCGRCGQNAGPSRPGSEAHQRRIARWLPKAVRMSTIGYFVLTVPLELRIRLRDPAVLSSLGRAVTRMFQRRGFHRGLRRWHWFGEPENGLHGMPTFSPHVNVLVDAGFLTLTQINSIKSAWMRVLKLRFGYGGSVVVHYSYAATPGQMYHRVRYVTRSTFLDWRWDGQMALALRGFRNSSTWGKWNGRELWKPESNDEPPSQAAENAVSGRCPGDHHESVVSVNWKESVVLPASRFRDWRDAGSGYYCMETRSKRHRTKPP